MNEQPLKPKRYLSSFRCRICFYPLSLLAMTKKVNRFPWIRYLGHSCQLDFSFRIIVLFQQQRIVGGEYCTTFQLDFRSCITTYNILTTFGNLGIVLLSTLASSILDMLARFIRLYWHTLWSNNFCGFSCRFNDWNINRRTKPYFFK